MPIQDEQCLALQGNGGNMPSRFLGRSVFEDNYILDGLIGEGACAYVFRARHTSIDNLQAAVKVLKPHLVATETEARFVREAHIACAVKDSHVLKPFGVGKLHGRIPYIVMELIDGRSLEQEVLENPKPASVERIVKTIHRIAVAVCSAHDVSVVHRDLAPRNILLTRRGSRDYDVRVLDFGMARARGALDSPISDGAGPLGTPGFIAPELYAQAADHRSDIFSVGALLYFWLVRDRKPLLDYQQYFLSPSRRRSGEGLAFIASVRPSHLEPVPEALERIVRTALQCDPALRQSSMGALVEELRAFLWGSAEQGGGPAGNGLVARPLTTQISAANVVPIRRDQIATQSGPPLGLIGGFARRANMAFETTMGPLAGTAPPPDAPTLR